MSFLVVLVVDDLDTFERQQERVANLLDAAKRLELLLGAAVAHVAVDDLDGLGKTTRRRGLPHLAITAGAKALEQLVARDGFGARLRKDCHGRGTAAIGT